jgi:hypothetical protein
MELEDILPCQQELVKSPYPEPDDSNPYFPSYFSKICFDINLPRICMSF